MGGFQGIPMIYRAKVALDTQIFVPGQGEAMEKLGDFRTYPWKLTNWYSTHTYMYIYIYMLTYFFKKMMTLPINIWSRSRFHVSLLKSVWYSKMWHSQRHNPPQGHVTFLTQKRNSQLGTLHSIGFANVFTTLPSGNLLHSY